MICWEFFPVILKVTAVESMEHNTHNGNKDDLAVILGADIVVIYLCCWQKKSPEIKVFNSRNILIISHATFSNHGL